MDQGTIIDAHGSRLSFLVQDQQSHAKYYEQERKFNALSTLPMQGSVEQIIETAGGWQPGMRAKFDVALMNHDKASVSSMLPYVPTEYKQRFDTEIKGVLG